MLQEGQELAGYRLRQMIGEGGMGQVFLAEQLRLGRQVAMKVVRLDVKGEAALGTTSPAEELTREAQALMALEHPHILPLYDAGREGNLAYLVMPYIPEGSLQEVLRPGPRRRLQLPLPPGEALLYLEQAASALQYAHDRNVIHRDVKPANFLVRLLTRSHAQNQTVNRLHLFLADFGLSKFLTYSTNTTHLSGTPAYMAPEQFEGHASPASDQYSLAILFYYLLTGDLPFRGSPVELMFKHLHEPPPAAHTRVKGLPEPLAGVIQRGMAKTPEERYPSVSALAEAARDTLIEAGLVPSHDSFPVIAAVRISDPTLPASEHPLEQPMKEQPAKEGREAAPVASDAPEPAALPEVSLSQPVGLPVDALATTKDMAEASTQASLEQRNRSSLPTIPMGKPRRPPRRAEKPAGRSREGQPHRRGRIIALAALAAIIVIGGVLGAGLLLQQHKGDSPVAQGTQTQQIGPTNTVPPSVTSAPPSPTAIPPSTILDKILANNPISQVDLTQGSGQWNTVPINGSNYNGIHTPTGVLDIVNMKATYNKQTYSAPLAVAVDLHASSDQEFDILLDTTDGSGGHQYYNLKLTTSAPPEVDLSTDGNNFAVHGKGSTANSAWADGSTHTLVLVLDGTRLLFYIDRANLLDTQVPLPKTTVALTLATLNEAFVTGINIYAVPQS